MADAVLDGLELRHPALAAATAQEVQEFAGLEEAAESAATAGTGEDRTAAPEAEHQEAPGESAPLEGEDAESASSQAGEPESA